MKKQQLKEEMIKAISGELDQWLEESEHVESAYDYEERFLLHMRKLSNILLQKSVGEVPQNRNNKKNSTRVQA